MKRISRLQMSDGVKVQAEVLSGLGDTFEPVRIFLVLSVFSLRQLCFIQVLVSVEWMWRFLDVVGT